MCLPGAPGASHESTVTEAGGPACPRSLRVLWAQKEPCASWDSSAPSAGEPWGLTAHKAPGHQGHKPLTTVLEKELLTHLRATPEGLRAWGFLQLANLGRPGDQATLTTLTHGPAGTPLSGHVPPWKHVFGLWLTWPLG